MKYSSFVRTFAMVVIAASVLSMAVVIVGCTAIFMRATHKAAQDVERQQAERGQR